MDVIVDGKSNFELQGNPESLVSALGAVTDFLRAQSRAIVSVQLDGQNIAPEAVADFESESLKEAQKLEVVSKPLDELARTSLDNLSAVLPELSVACRQLAEVFQGETPSTGYEPFVELAAIWQHVKEQELMIVRLLDLDIEEVVIGGTPLSKLQEELNTFLEEAAGALKSEDTVLLGDLLEYELAPRAEKESDIVAHLQERVTAIAG